MNWNEAIQKIEDERRAERARSLHEVDGLRETKRRASGRCPRCGHETESAHAGTVACKWGGCNGTIEAQPIK